MPTAPRFDEYQFQRNAMPVSSDTCIAFSDYKTMHVEEHKLAPNRRNDAPVWAYNDSLLRHVLVTYLEARAAICGYWRKPKPEGTLRERLDRACGRLQAQVPAHIKNLQRLCAEYVAGKRAPEPDAARLRRLEICIENIDSQIISASRVAQNVVAIVRLYYSVGLNSVEIAEALHVKSPVVRQALWRLNRTWEHMQERGDLNNSGIPEHVQRAAAMLAEGKPWKEICAALGRTHTNALRRELRRYGLYNPRQQRTATSSINTDTVRRLRAAGYSFPQISEYMGRSREAVYYAFKYGLNGNAGQMRPACREQVAC